MYTQYSTHQFKTYNEARNKLIADPSILIRLEKFFSESINEIITNNIKEIVADYNEASYLYPFWKNYPPDERGRKPRGDQYPWIEVGEHAVGDKLPRLLDKQFVVRDVGIPTGPDKRFVLASPSITEITSGLTDSAWLFIDIKSVGPRDDFGHTVMSHNQISGDGIWDDPNKGMTNSTIIALGKHVSHEFFCSIPPLYVLSDNKVVPVILMAIKPVYSMLSLDPESHKNGQPLQRIAIASIPNGLLLEENPGYLKKYPGLFFPGKDDKSKNPLKIRSRISFSILQQIDTWRVNDIYAGVRQAQSDESVE